MSININKFYAYPAYLLFFIMLFAPVSYKYIKVPLIGLSLIIIIGYTLLVKKGHIALDKQVLSITWILSIYGLFSMLLGSFNGNPGALQMGTVHVIWPYLYLIFVIGMSKENVIKGLLKTLFVSSIAIELYILSFILYSKGILGFLYIELDLGQSIGFYQGYTEFNIYSLSTMIFLIPFSFAYLCVYTIDKEKIVKKKWVWLSFILGCIIVILSGRRALMLTSALSVFVIWFLTRFLPRQDKKRVNRVMLKVFVSSFIISICAFIYLQNNLGFNFSLFIENIMDGFNFSDSHNDSAYFRNTQAHALINGWKENPLFGKGLGAKADVIRSEDMPWAYELQYLALLFHTGLVGLIFYTSAIAWIFIKVIKLIKNGYGVKIIPVLTGLSSFLIANATNPYLAKYDYLWVIFLPVGIINFYLMERKNENHTSDKKDSLSNSYELAK